VKHIIPILVVLLLLSSGFVGVSYSIDDIEQSTIPTFYDGNILYVGGSGPGNYSKIQDAINDSEDGDTVFVYNGTYYENVEIYTAINLIGEDRNTTIINGRNSSSIIYVTADWVNISGFTIEFSGDWNEGIALRSNNNTIAGNIISNNWYGIHLFESNSNIITGNTVSNNWNVQWGVIYILYSNNNIISDNNIISNSKDGIHLEVSNSNTISDNNIISNDKVGIHLEVSNSNTISGNKITNNYHGICLYKASNNIISENIISNNTFGIETMDSSNNAILENTVSNAWHAIFIDNSSNNIISENTISSNYLDGIMMNEESINNIFYHNNFINNTYQAYDDGNNTWDNGYPSCGNYWSDYTGIDNYSGPNQDLLGSDGVGDTPYDISGDSNQDRYPLMESYGMTKLTMNIGWGLLKFSGGIKNNGNKTAFNVQWKIAIDGGIILIGRESSGTIPKPLLAGEETTVSSVIVFGFGPIMITVAVWADNAPLVSGTISGFLLLFFIKINPGGGI